MTAGLPTISPLPPPNWNRSLFDWIIKSSITFVWLFVVRAENAMMGGVQCFLSPPKPSSTSCWWDRNWNWTLFNWAGELSTPKLKPRRLNKITVMEISQSINHFRVHWLFKMRRLKVKTQHDILFLWSRWIFSVWENWRTCGAISMPWGQRITRITWITWITLQCRFLDSSGLAPSQAHHASIQVKTL